MRDDGHGRQSGIRQIPRFGVAADVPATDLPLLLGAGLVNDLVEALDLCAP
jgi:hypothetical protein